MSLEIPEGSAKSYRYNTSTNYVNIYKQRLTRTHVRCKNRPRSNKLRNSIPLEIHRALSGPGSSITLRSRTVHFSTLSQRSLSAVAKHPVDKYNKI
mgnify:CR=1 FL=1